MSTSGGEEYLDLFLNGASHPSSSSLDTNILIFSCDITSPLIQGGVYENQQKVISGGNMEALLQRYHEYLCGEHANNNTITNKLGATRALLQQTNGIINQETIQQLKIWANQHYSHNSRNNKINAWNEFLRWYGCPELKLKHIGFIETNQYALNEEEIDVLLDEAKRDELSRLVILCLFDGALRPSEIIDIRLDQKDGNRLYLDDTKTGDKRIILSPMLIEAWDKYLKVRPRPQPGHEQYLILKTNHKQPGTKYIDTDPIIDITKNIARLSNITKIVTPYTIRRSSATLRQNKYSKYYMGDVKLVQTLFRHKDIVTTLRYDRTSDIDIERYFDDQTKRNKLEESEINSEANGINTKENGANLIYSSPQTELNQEEQDNNSFCFSITFFVSVSEAWDSIVWDPLYFCFLSSERFAHASVRVTENLNPVWVAWSVTGSCDYPLLPMPSTFPFVESSFYIGGGAE